MRFVPYITLDGNAAEAVEFYLKALGATNKGLMRFGDAPDSEHPVPPEAASRVMHAHIEVAGHSLYLSDTFPGGSYQLGDQVSIAVVFEDEAKVREVYHHLSSGGTVVMELQKTFWSPAFAMVKDKFGITWQLTMDSSR